METPFENKNETFTFGKMEPKFLSLFLPLSTKAPDTVYKANIRRL